MELIPTQHFYYNSNEIYEKVANFRDSQKWCVLYSKINEESGTRLFK